MTSRRFLGLLLLLALIAVPGSALAVGPLDGSYQVTLTAEDFGSSTMYIVVLQNDTTVGMAFLDTIGLWFYGSGPLDAQQHVKGPILDFAQDNLEVGQFDLRFPGDGSVTGTMIDQFDFPFVVSGGRFF